MGTWNSTIIWRGDSGLPRGNYGKTNYKKNISIATLRTFAIALKAHSLCNRAILQNAFVELKTDVEPGTGANVDKLAVLYFRDPTTLEVLHFSYPAPIAADIEDVGYGKRIKKSAVIAIINDLNTSTGESYEPRYGVYLERV